jgi:ABC-2 type transport system permease protein
MNLFQSAYVIGRRDFVATVWSKTFLFFLLTPLFILGVSFLFGMKSGEMAREDFRTSIAIISSKAEFQEINAARLQLNPAFGMNGLPEQVLAAQVRELLQAKDKRIRAVLTGGVARPKLTGDIERQGSTRKQIHLILEEIGQQRALTSAGTKPPEIDVQVVTVGESASSLATMRAVTARAALLILFMMTLLLSTMLLSNLVEEKSNKVIEVLAAAIPVDAIFVGKLFSMLAISLVGVTVWAVAAGLGLFLSPMQISFPEPAVGWPAFALLLLAFYTANYLLLGAMFLGIGSQAASIREVQTMSLPVTMAQLAIFFFAFIGVGQLDSVVGIAAAVFPFSSPLAMLARAAQTSELWPHGIALLWQALWVWLTIKVSAALFRHNVMKSGSGGLARYFRRARA